LTGFLELRPVLSRLKILTLEEPRNLVHLTADRGNENTPRDDDLYGMADAYLSPAQHRQGLPNSGPGLDGARFLNL
jgi:hypothetical protein